VKVQSGQRRSGQAGREPCLSPGDWRGRSVGSEDAGREGAAPKSFTVADADAVSLAEGSIRTTVKARSLGAAGVPSPGHAFTRIPQEPGRPPVSSRMYRHGTPDRNGPGPGWDGCPGPWERTCIQRRGTASSRETGDGRDGQGGVVRPSEYRRRWGTGASRDPLEGRGGTDRRIGRGRHAGTQRSSTHVHGTLSSRQDCNPAGGRPAVSIAQFGHVAMPHPVWVTAREYAWCKRPGRPDTMLSAVGATGGPSERGSLKRSEWLQPRNGHSVEVALQRFPVCRACEF
jgi:hypothetical protein